MGSQEAFVAHRPYFLGEIEDTCVSCHPQRRPQGPERLSAESQAGVEVDASPFFLEAAVASKKMARAVSPTKRNNSATHPANSSRRDP